MIRVTIADDHPIVRQGLRQILIDDPDIKVVGEADTAQKLLELIRKIRCDIVVLDIGMPGMSGLDALKQLKDEYPKLPVLILSVHPEDQYAVRVIKAGAAGYLTKDSAPEELIDAIRRVVIGRKYISPSLAEILASGAWTSGMPAHEKLSDREFQILGLIASGKRTREIAEELSLSPKTVSTYRSRILQKMAMKSTADLMIYARKARLVE